MVNQFFHSHNEKSMDDFLNLSPNQMQFLYNPFSLTYNPFSLTNEVFILTSAFSDMKVNDFNRLQIPWVTTMGVGNKLKDRL